MNVGISFWLLLLITSGIGALLGSSVLFWRGLQSRSWPSVEGTIVHLQIREQVVDTTDTGDPIVCVFPNIEYEYEVAGNTYRSTRIRFGGTLYWSGEEAIRKLSEMYAPGTPVRVHYNPKRPQEALLEPGISAVAWILFAVGMSALLMSGLFLWRLGQT